MIYYIIAAIVLAGVIVIFSQFQRKKRLNVEKDALQLAWEKKDYDTYIAIINEKIAKSKQKSEKNVLATLKLQAYINQKQWQQMDALKKQIKTKELPKKIHLTFITQYIIGLCLSERPEAALKWMEIEEPIIKEAEANGTYKMYLTTLKALKSFYSGNFKESREYFTRLKNMKIGGDFYPPFFADYLARIENAEQK